jgi:hypothetical protein
MMRWSVRFYACFCFNALLNFPILSGRRILSASEYGEFPAFNRQLLEATNISYSQKQITTPESHRVTSLPGLKESEKIVHFAGHINVDEQAEGNIFYWLIEAQTVDPATGFKHAFICVYINIKAVLVYPFFEVYHVYHFCFLMIYLSFTFIPLSSCPRLVEWRARMFQYGW